MCGIAGIFRTNTSRQSYRDAIVQSTECMKHRGPDAEGLFIDESHGIYLGHRRLAIIDLNPRSNQPFKDHTGRYIMVFNGQIYNFKEIKAEIPEYPFTTTSDTEVILAAYARWGTQCLEKMNGMFALAIYDTVDHSLFLARDRFGIKPLYYYKDKEVFLFASEIRALLKTGLVPKKIDRQGMTEMLMYQAAACPNSIVEDVKQLHPAHYAYIRDGRMEEKRYWAFGTSANGVAKNYRQACSDVKQLFFESIERRMVSDVPLGAFLSGGIDSSAIVALMSKVKSPVDTFSIVFNEPEYDESPYSDLMAAKYATHHHKLLLSPEDFLSELPNALDAMDSPSADGMNVYVVSKLTRKAGVTVAMSGLGGDELFAGYPNFKVWKTLHAKGFFILPRPIQRLLSGAMSKHMKGISHGRITTIARSNGLMSVAYPAFREVMGKSELAELVGNGVPILKDHVRMQEDERMDGMSPLSQYSIAELSYYTRDVLLKDTDQFSMASSLEVRDPFFDHLLVDYVLRLPDKWKLGNTPKQLLCDSMGDLLPEVIINRKKRGFTFPWKVWLKNELSATVENSIEFLADLPEFNGNAIRKLHADFLRNDAGVTWKYVWQLVALGSWIRKNLRA